MVSTRVYRASWVMQSFQSLPRTLLHRACTACRIKTASHFFKNSRACPQLILPLTTSSWKEVGEHTQNENCSPPKTRPLPSVASTVSSTHSENIYKSGGASVARSSRAPRMSQDSITSSFCSIVSSPYRIKAWGLEPPPRVIAAPSRRRDRKTVLGQRKLDRLPLLPCRQ
jgi:hypothetical protein